MAKTFDNISEASATNYLFLFAQRTLALQNEPPTPPPLNALGLPCQVICRPWAWRKESAVKEKLAGESEQEGGAREVVVPSSDNALEGTVAKATAEKAHLWLGSVNSDEATQTKTAPVEETVAIKAVAVELAAAAGVLGGGAAAASEEAATEKKVSIKAHSIVKNDGQGEDKEQTFAQRSRHSRGRSRSISLTTKTTRRRRIAGAPL